MARHEYPEDVNSANEILRLIVGNHPLPLQIQQELVDQNKPLAETSAGEEVNRELVAKMERHEQEMRNLQQELQGTILCSTVLFQLNRFRFAEARGDTKQELDRELKEHEKEVRKVKAEMERLKGSKILWVLGGVALGGGLALAGAAGLVVWSAQASPALQGAMLTVGRVIHQIVS
jgi:hypothetical protein